MADEDKKDGVDHITLKLKSQVCTFSQPAGTRRCCRLYADSATNNLRTEIFIFTLRLRPGWCADTH